MMKVAEITISGLTPIKLAMRGFSAVARIARPKRVALTNQESTANATTVSPKIINCVGVITASPIGIGVVGKSVGNGL